MFSVHTPHLGRFFYALAILFGRGMLFSMRISSKSKIAFNVLLDIAAHTVHGHAISMPLISKRHGLSLTYLEIIFAALKSAGMIQSHRGPGGGYSLAIGPEKISLRDVIGVIDGDQAAGSELGAELWADLQTFMFEKMSQVTLASTLEQSSVTIESSTKGLPSIKPHAKQRASTKLAEKVAKSTPAKKVKPQLGPNSIFTFGKYLRLKKT